MKISVITVGMNHLAYIKKLYKSLYVDHKPKCSFEAIYVDNCSTDGSVEYLQKEYPEIKIIVNKVPYGFGHNNNIGAKIAKGDFLAIINPDIVLQEGSLDLMLDYYEKSDVGLLVPQLLNLDMSLQYSSRHFMTLSLFINRIITRGNDLTLNKKIAYYLCADQDHSLIRNIDWAIGAAFFLSQKLYRKLSGFDESYFLYMEDEDLCLRCWKAGYSVRYFPPAKMIHNHLRGSSKIGKKSIMHFKSLILFWKKHGLNVKSYVD